MLYDKKIKIITDLCLIKEKIWQNVVEYDLLSRL
jgi:hypothetical protein